VSFLPSEHRDFANRPMFSVCLPQLAVAEFRTEAQRKHLREWNWLSLLLEMSFNDPWVIEKVGDCRFPVSVNLEVKLEHETLRRLRYFSKIAEISPATYVQRLLYHVYVTREIIRDKRAVDSIYFAEQPRIYVFKRSENKAVTKKAD
jgi:hypothetical protein